MLIAAPLASTMDVPPSAIRTPPVSNEESSQARKLQILAISSGLPIRRSGEKEVNFSKIQLRSLPNVCANGRILFSNMGVLIAPGQITLQRI